MIISLRNKPSIPRNIVQCNIIAVPIKIGQNKVEQILIENSVSLNQQNEINFMIQVSRFQ